MSQNKIGIIASRGSGKANFQNILAKMTGMSDREIEELIDQEEFAGKVESKFSEKMSIEIPKSMTKIQASKELKRQWDEEESLVSIFQDFQGWFPTDTLHAFTKVFENHFGWIDSKPTMSWGGPMPPRDIKVQTDVDTYTSVFFGKMNISPWDDAELSVGVNDISAVVQIKVKKRFRKEADDLISAVFNYLKSDSIFRGKTVVVSDPKDFQFPNFEIIANKPDENIKLNEGSANVIETFVLPEILERQKKRVYLFTGSYGNGKTETAMKIGKFANSEGITFFYCKDSKYFNFLLTLSKTYGPMIVFQEDIDEIGSGEQRDSKMNTLLNTLDGVESKGSKLKVIFTTNHQDRINPALRRPGRIDMVVEFNNPDKNSIIEILSAYLRNFEGFDSLDLTMLAQKFPDVQGAFIAEIAKRAVKVAIRDGKITEKMVLASIESMMPQIKLMQSEVKQISFEKQFVDNLSQLMVDSAFKGIDKYERG